VVVAARVEVHGLAELSRAFDATANDIPGAVAKREGGFASSVVSTASGLMGSKGSELVARGNVIQYGGIASQVVDFRGVKGGRYVYPTIARQWSKLLDAAGEGALDAAASHGFEVHR
jgi:hypothetical protein